MNVLNDTICALATPNGIGAIALIRISGSKSLEIGTKTLKGNWLNPQSHKSVFCSFYDNEGLLIDEVLLTYFKEGKSFTAEESIEISCHASPYIQQQILQTLVQNGCRMAKAGEFTQRAFLNGKMDLIQAEAIADLIASESKHAHDIALKQMRGSFSSELQILREKLIHFASMIELELDFAEEDVEFADRTQLKLLLEEVLTYIRKLMRSFQLGNALKNGIPVAIVGAPNTGKSTLLNQFLGEDRAIVSPIAGTTRDVIEETLNIDGILFRLIDTAGIRDTIETIEALGIERSKSKIEQASIVLCMADANDSENLEYTKHWVETLKQQFPEKSIYLLLNKIDISQYSTDFNEIGVISIAAKTGYGIEELKKKMSNSVLHGQVIGEQTIVSNLRHFEALQGSEQSLIQAENGLQNGVTGDFIAMDIRQALHELGSITGSISTEDLLGNIFSKFCIGK